MNKKQKTGLLSFLLGSLGIIALFYGIGNDSLVTSLVGLLLVGIGLVVLVVICPPANGGGGSNIPFGW